MEAEGAKLFSWLGCKAVLGEACCGGPAAEVYVDVVLGDQRMSPSSTTTLLSSDLIVKSEVLCVVTMKSWDQLCVGEILVEVGRLSCVGGVREVCEGVEAVSCSMKAVWTVDSVMEEVEVMCEESRKSVWSMNGGVEESTGVLDNRGTGVGECVLAGCSVVFVAELWTTPPVVRTVVGVEKESEKREVPPSSVVEERVSMVVYAFMKSLCVFSVAVCVFLLFPCVNVENAFGDHERLSVLRGDVV